MEVLTLDPRMHTFVQLHTSTSFREKFFNSGRAVRMNRSPLAIISLLLFTSVVLFAQQTPPAAEPSAPAAAPTPSYTPKYRTDPARSDSEFEALAYMRVVMRAEVGFNKHYGHYANSLPQLVHSGTFTQRMVNPDRGDYTVGYRAKKDNYILILTPKALDAEHRSFYTDADGKIHADEAKAADPESPVIETHHW